MSDLRRLAWFGLVALALLVLWNLTDPLPPAWDEAQHLLMAQRFAEHVHRFVPTAEWWRQFWQLSQRYPPLTYWLALPFGLVGVFDRSGGQVLNLMLLGILAWATGRIGRLGWGQGVGWLSAGLILLYPAITGLAHVYMTDLVLVVAVTLGFGAALSYWLRPSWGSSVGLGLALAAVLLAKWNGLLFLLLPLAAIGMRALRRWQHLAQVGLMGLIALTLAWPWYGSNLVFVVSNSFNYASTAHYYQECGGAAWCEWTAYLRWLPGQMSPLLVLLPLLAFWRPQTLGSATLPTLATLIAGLAIHTLIEIKDPRFTTPLLPLLAVLAAVGVWANPRLSRTALALLAGLALAWVGQPLTPGAMPLWLGIRQRLSGNVVQHDLMEWLQTQARPQDLLQATVGVLPNTEQIGAETLTYLARVMRLPLAFVPVGHSTWPELEVSLLDRHLVLWGDWGNVGPFRVGKEAMWRHLHTSPAWRSRRSEVIPSIGSLQTYTRRDPPVDIQAIAPVGEIRLEGMDPPRLCRGDGRTMVGELRWAGPAAALATTPVWTDLLRTDGTVVARSDFGVGLGQLRRAQTGSVLLRQSWRLEAQSPVEIGSAYRLRIRWATEQKERDFSVTEWMNCQEMPVSLLTTLERAADGAVRGDLDRLSRYLSLWSTHRYQPASTDPDLAEQLLARRLQEATDSLPDQVSYRYQLALIAISHLRVQDAMVQFAQLTKIDPDNPWHRAYLALVRLGFALDFRNAQQDIRYLLNPLHQNGSFCNPAVLPPGHSNDLCNWLTDLDLISTPDQ